MCVSKDLHGCIAVLMLFCVSGNGLMLNNESFLGKSHFGFKEEEKINNDIWDLDSMV